MKKELKELLNSERGTLKINKYTMLYRWQKNQAGYDRDKLEVSFAITNSCDYTKEIKSRDMQGIIEEVNIATTEAFEKASKHYISELTNGHLTR